MVDFEEPAEPTCEEVSWGCRCSSGNVGTLQSCPSDLSCCIKTTTFCECFNPTAGHTCGWYTGANGGAVVSTCPS